ncbi:MAG: hypothetical protein ACPG77_14060 [Nannocystaceae bacterium]
MRWLAGLVAFVGLHACTTPSELCGDASPPEIVLGVGTTSFEALADGDIVDFEYGFQGGVHSFFALEVSGLRSGDTYTSFTVVTEDGREVGTLFEYRAIKCRAGVLQTGEMQLIWRAEPDMLDGQEVRIQVLVEDSGGQTQALERIVVLRQSH